jgi:hypothetical protein
MKKTRMILAISMAKYFLTSASLASGSDKSAAILQARRQLALYWAIRYELNGV